MKQGKTELVFVLDKSGSMGPLVSDTIGGFNSFLDKQRELEGECIITTVLFNQGISVLHDRLDIHAVRPLTKKDYQPGGMTAMFDGIGYAIDKIVNVQRQADEDYRAEKVIFVIITDGYENASKEYTHSEIKKKIEHESTKYGWEFVFLGANIDAADTAASIGVPKTHASNYVPDVRGVEIAYGAAESFARSVRLDELDASTGLESVRRDYEDRGRR